MVAIDGVGKMLSDDGGDCALLIRRQYQDAGDGECAMLQQKTNEANKKHLNEVATAITVSVTSLFTIMGATYATLSGISSI